MPWSRAGVDIVEIGLPYSDPLMDGPTIQAAVAAVPGRPDRPSPTCCSTVSASGATGAPTLVMSYWNPIERRGCRRLREGAGRGRRRRGDHARHHPRRGRRVGRRDRRARLARVFLVAPSSTPERIAAVAAVTTGFVYAASTMGVTGARAAVGRQARDLVGPGAGRHRPPRRRRPGRLHRATRPREVAGVRRRGDRRLGRSSARILRPHSTTPARSTAVKEPRASWRGRAPPSVSRCRVRLRSRTCRGSSRPARRR